MTRIGLALAAALAVAACGNANPEAAKALRELPRALFSKKQPPQPITPEQMAKALASTQQAVYLLDLERLQAQVLMQAIERNGPYQTFGNSARQVVVLREGMITSTRGLGGGDLMSSEEDSLLGRIRSRSAGTVSYDQRFLTPEDVTVVKRYTCSVVPGGPTPVLSGLVQTTGYSVTATCIAVDGISPDFTNTYALSGDGYILTSKQWAGSTIGYVKTLALRR
jgi:hypothetical protein